MPRGLRREDLPTACQGREATNLAIPEMIQPDEYGRVGPDAYDDGRKEVVGTTVGEPMKYFFAVIVSLLLLVPGCQKAPEVLQPKPVATPATTSPPPKPIKTHHISVIGDSLTEGSGEGGGGYTGWPALVWPTLQSSVGIVLPKLAAEGASGYVHRGHSGGVFGDKVALVVRPEDELVVFFGSSNDSAASTGALASTVREAFAKTKAAAPAAKLLVIGPVSPPTRPPRSRGYPPFSATKRKPWVLCSLIPSLRAGWPDTPN